MSSTARMTIAFSPETRELMERLVPDGKRTAFVDEVVREALRRRERDVLDREMAECAREMHEEIMQIQEEMTPLEEELHRSQ